MIKWRVYRFCGLKGETDLSPISFVTNSLAEAKTRLGYKTKMQPQPAIVAAAYSITPQTFGFSKERLRVKLMGSDLFFYDDEFVKARMELVSLSKKISNLEEIVLKLNRVTSVLCELFETCETDKVIEELIKQQSYRWWIQGPVSSTSIKQLKQLIEEKTGLTGEDAHSLWLRTLRPDHEQYATKNWVTPVFKTKIVQQKSNFLSDVTLSDSTKTVLKRWQKTLSWLQYYSEYGYLYSKKALSLLPQDKTEKMLVILKAAKKIAGENLEIEKSELS